LVEHGKTSLIEFNVDSIARVEPLNGRLIAVSGSVERRPAERFGQVSREPLIMLRVQFVLERMSRSRILKAEQVPFAAQCQDSVEPANRFVKSPVPWFHFSARLPAALREAMV
jgi:hypothetical protein